MRALKLLSAGAAEGLISVLGPQFEAANGCCFRAQFGTAGFIAAKIEAEESADAVILPSRFVEKLGPTGHVMSATTVPLGTVATALAVRRGDILPNIETAENLRNALLAAEQIYAPEWRNATAGIHFKQVLERLDIWDSVSSRVKECAGGAASMDALAAGHGRAIACGQATEILANPNVVLAGALPSEFKLETLYVATICRSVADLALAEAFLQMITGAESRPKRASAGFL